MPPAEAYGPQGGVVSKHLARARLVRQDQIQVVGWLWSGGNDRPAYERAHVDIVTSAVQRAATFGGRRSHVRTAFLDGQAAVFLACNPPALSLEHWWNNFPDVPAVASGGYAAAALTVSDLIDEAILGVALAPWRALDEGLPDDLFGPNHHDVMAFLAAAAVLSDDQIERIVAVWGREPRGELESFGHGGPLEVRDGREEWMPRQKGRRHRAWISLLSEIDREVRRNRWFDMARMNVREGSARYGRRPEHLVRVYLQGALEAALTATMFADVGDSAVLIELRQAWDARDAGDPPELIWWQRRWDGIDAGQIRFVLRHGR